MTQIPTTVLPTDDPGDNSTGTKWNRSWVQALLDAVNPLLHSTTNPTVTPSNIIDEIVASRGNLTSLNDRLDGVIDADGNFIGSTGNATDSSVLHGATVSATEVVYMSDGTDGRTAGRFYKPDAAAPKGSIVGISVNGALIGTFGLVRVGGRITGLAGLTAGTIYYADTATPGALTATPTANLIKVGRADSTTSLIIEQNPLIASATSAGILTTGAQDIPGIKNFLARPTGLGQLIQSYCTADFTKNNSLTLGDVTGMSFPVVANGIYDFYFVIHWKSTAVANIKFTLTGPAAPTAIRFGVPSAGQSVFGNTCGIVGAGADVTAILSGQLRNGANAGTVQLQMAQSNLEATNTVVYAESSVNAWRIS